jgi:hypothetical protein
MGPIDFLKAAAMAALVLVLDVLIAIAVVFAWAIFVDPGHPRDYWETAAIPIARWSTRLFGTAIIFASSYGFAASRKARNGFLFGATLVAFYALFDGMTVWFKEFFTLSIALTMLIKLLGALAGAALANRGHAHR